MNVQEVLSQLSAVRPRGEGWMARCPVHDDKRPSLSIDMAPDGRVLVHCHAGCSQESVLESLGIKPGERGPDQPVRAHPSISLATVQPPGLRLADYAAAKRLDEGFLRRIGLRDASWSGRPAIAVPYYGVDGEERGLRFRIALHGDRFRWRRGSKPCPYGLWRLPEARSVGRLVLVEGESDAQTLWFHGVPALGLPGASSWQPEWSDYLTGIARLDAVIEPDVGGEALLARLAASDIADRFGLIRLQGCKDVSELYGRDPDAFPTAWRLAQEAARPLTGVLAAKIEADREAAWITCAELAQSTDILSRFGAALEAAGAVGETPAAKLLYLVFTSRITQHPVSAIVKGPSSAGKSFLVERVLRFFPDSAAYALSAMSEKALAYSEEPLSHRILVLYESAGLTSPFANYLLRSLLSEGRVRYETVDDTAQGRKARLIEREGPTALVLTTTAVKVHPENETRLLSITVTDTREQTKAVMRAIARPAGPVDLAPWLALQHWLADGPGEAKVPFAEALAELMPPVAVRLRRDFSQLLALVGTHALLQQATRVRDSDGGVIATLDDYSVVRELIGGIIAEGLGVLVPPMLRETVDAVRHLRLEDGATVTRLAEELGLDKSSAWRRVRNAVEAGYLRNLEDRKGRPARVVIGDPLPEEQEVLPTLERLQGCTVARESEESAHTPPDVEARS